MKRRLIATATLIAVLAAPAWAQVMFTDVDQTHPQWDAIEHTVAFGLFNGYEDGTFRPDQPVTNGQIGKVIARAFPDGQLSRADLAEVMTAYHNTVHPLVWSGDKAADAPPQPVVFKPVFSEGLLVIQVDLWTDRRAADALVAYQVFNYDQEQITSGWVDLPRGNMAGRFRTEIPCLWDERGSVWRGAEFVRFHIWEPPPVGGGITGGFGIPPTWCG